jgi:chromosome segregation ATPase
MTIFKSAKVTELEARIAELEAENTTLSESANAVSERNEELAGANERIVELEAANAEIPTLNATITTHEATITEKDAEIVKLTEKAEITEAKIGEAAAQLLAAQGHSEPVDLSGSNIDKTANTKTLAEFNNLSPVARNEFIRNGGKLTD